MSRKRKNKGENEIIFKTIINNRNLEHVLNPHVIELLKQSNQLYDELINIEPLECNINKYKLLRKEYKAIKNELWENGFVEFIRDDSDTKTYKFLNSIKPYTLEKIKNFKKSHRYSHKQIEFKPVERVITIEDLLEENNKIIQHFYSFTDNELIKVFEEFERYKVIQHILSNKNVRYKKFTINDTSYPRIVTLLGGKCENCGSQYKLTLHHIIPKSEGGEHDILNLQLLCRKCHDMTHIILNKSKTVNIIYNNYNCENEISMNN